VRPILRIMFRGWCCCPSRGFFGFAFYTLRCEAEFYPHYAACHFLWPDGPGWGHSTQAGDPGGAYGRGAALRGAEVESAVVFMGIPYARPPLGGIALGRSRKPRHAMDRK